MDSDLDIAHRARLEPIVELAGRRLGIPEQALEPYGRYKAKISLEHLDGLRQRPDGKLVLVSAISPTPAGEGKTTTVIGLGDALNRLGRRAVIALRQPSLGPVFGVKGGGAGGGRSQVMPMQDINLHFTGDFAAVGLAHNLLAAMLDNHLHQGNALGIDPRQIVWPRVMDLNDRALRNIVIGLGGPAHGVPRESGFDIVAASEVMAILCLADSLADLRRRLSGIVVARTTEGRPVTAGDLQAAGAMTTLLRDALQPNLVQTLEGNLALLHGGPFANIAHGCNSVLATRAALKLGEFAVTEAGFGADLGAEKFIDIKCRASGLYPDVIVLVATLRALKFHGGVALANLHEPDSQALERGLSNLRRHLKNLREVFGLRSVVALNRFEADRTDEIAMVGRAAEAFGAGFAIADHWTRGGEGAEALALAVIEQTRQEATAPRFAYPDRAGLLEKTRMLAQGLYGAAEVRVASAALKTISMLESEGFAHLPVCIAKTPYSLTTDPAILGAPDDHVLDVREVRLAAGAGFVVMICGNVMTMPGLPKNPAAHRIDVDPDGGIVGLG
jgi:formate--tetrahydrofolate ligase